MRLLAVLFASMFVRVAFATPIPVPEIPSGSAGYEAIKNTVRDAARRSNHYLDFAFHGINGSLCYQVDPNNIKNPLSLVLVLNGKYFLVPMLLASADNTHRFSVRPDGFYLEQNGFRVDLALDRPARLMATLKIADVNGVPLPALEYNETLSQAQTPDYLETHPNVTVGNFFVKTNHRSLRLTDGEPKPDSFIAPLKPGTMGYQKAIDMLNWGRDYDQVYYLNWEFNTVKGRMVVPGRGLVPSNEDYMIAEMNGQVFKLPFDFWYVDNRNTFTREVGTGPDGIYYTQRGMRVGSDSQTLYRIVAHVRIADLNGNVLDRLEYHETAAPAATTVSDILIEKDFF